MKLRQQLSAERIRNTFGAASSIEQKKMRVSLPNARFKGALKTRDNASQVRQLKAKMKALKGKKSSGSKLIL